jgi:hypothetical protein
VKAPGLPGVIFLGAKDCCRQTGDGYSAITAGHAPSGERQRYGVDLPAAACDV